MASQPVSNEITAANELETLHRYAEHNAEIPLAVAHQLAAPLLHDFDGIPPAVRHGCTIRLLGEFVMASENLAALILAYKSRNESPSFFRSITTYKSHAVTDLWNSITSRGWDRSDLRLPDDEPTLVRDAIQGIFDRDGRIAPMLMTGSAIPWDDADGMISEIARLITDKSTGVYRAAMKAKHGLPFTWSPPKYGSTLCFVDDDMIARNVIVSVKQTKTLLHAIDLACTASQRLATTAFGLASSGALYPPSGPCPVRPDKLPDKLR